MNAIVKVLTFYKRVTIHSNQVHLVLSVWNKISFSSRKISPVQLHNICIVFLSRTKINAAQIPTSITFHKMLLTYFISLVRNSFTPQHFSWVPTSRGKGTEWRVLFLWRTLTRLQVSTRNTSPLTVNNFTKNSVNSSCYWNLILYFWWKHRTFKLYFSVLLNF